MIKIGITGGIGCGKSTVCRLFAQKGVGVYDSDSEARRLMNTDGALRSALCERFGGEIYRSGELDRKALAARVFSDAEALNDLNRLVHPVVERDFGQWCAQRQEEDYVVMESAILFESGLEHMVDHTVAVLAPEALRVERAARRDGCDPELIRRRIAAQMPEEELASRADQVIVNIKEEDLEGAVTYLHRLFSREAALSLNKDR